MADNIVKIKFEGNSDTLTKAIKQLDTATKNLLNTQAKIVDSNKKSQSSSEKSKNSIRMLRLELNHQGKTLKDLQAPMFLYKDALRGSSFALAILRKATRSYIKDLNSTRNATDKNIKSNTIHNNSLLALGHSARQTGGAFSVLRSKLLLVNFALGLGVRQLNKFVQSASSVESMSRAFTTLQGGVNNSSIAIQKLQKATNNTMTSFDLFKQANNAMILGVSKNSDEMANMFDMAQRLGHAVGQDTRTSVESLVTGIGRQSRQMLDNIGIIVDSEKAYKDYASEIKKNVDNLTVLERKQAFLNATLDSARKKLEGLPKEVTDNTMVFQQLGVQFEEVSVKLGNELMPIFIETSKVLIDLLGSIDNKKIISFGATIASATQIFIAYKTAVVLAKIATMNFKKILIGSGIGIAILAFGKALQVLNEQLLKQQQRLSTVKKRIEDLKNEIDDYRKFLEGVTEKEEERAKKIIEDYGNAVKSMINFQNETAKAISEEIRLMQLSQEERDRITKLRSDRAKKFAEFEQKYGKDTVARNKDIFKQLAVVVTEYESLQEDQLQKSNEAQQGAFDFLMSLQKGRTSELNKEQQAIFDNEMSINASRTEEEMKAMEEQKLRRDEWLAYKAETDQLDFEREALINQMRTESQENAHKEYLKRLQEQRNAQAIADKDSLKKMEVIVMASKAVTNQLKSNLDSRVEQELASLRDTEAYQKASAEKRQTMEDKVAKGYAEQRKKIFILEKMASLGEVYISTAEAVQRAIKISPQTFGQPFAGYAVASGAIQAGAIMAQQPPVYETGGLVGGRRHSQGGTLIEAEQGEFVMSRSAVQAVGLEQMNEINQGNTGGVTVNVTAPLVDETVVDSIIPAIEKATRLNLA
ncbi:MAG: hypothetical protein CM15mV137_240 [uncultured marine virus]|nr:MAG: hypothetical protein CM15mV137_240 [uncultured marine virus]